jgi:hypothetical protein
MHSSKGAFGQKPFGQKGIWSTQRLVDTAMIPSLGRKILVLSVC